jgi:ketosteroid isomerase-like protein
MAHPNIEVLRGSDEAMLAGDVERFFSFFTDDVVMHIVGQNKLAGVYKGKGEFQDVFTRFSEAAGDYSFENHAYLADDEHGVVMQKGKLARDGETFEEDEVFIAHLRDGKISEMWYLPTDQAGFDAWIG